MGFGGKGANQSIAAAKLGARTALVAKVCLSSTKNRAKEISFSSLLNAYHGRVNIISK